jgi:hypothetical protein
VDERWVDDLRTTHHLRHTVQNIKAFVHGDLEDRRRRINRGVDGREPFRIPASSGELRAPPAIPRGLILARIETPAEKLGRRPREDGQGKVVKVRRSRVNAELHPQEQIFDELGTGSRNQKVDRAPPVKADLGITQPRFRGFL